MTSAVARPQVERLGDDLHLTYKWGLVAELSAIQDTSQGLRARMKLCQHGGKLWTGRIVLESPRDRSGVARALGLLEKELPWELILSQINDVAIETWEKPESFVTLNGQVPEPPKWLVRNFLPEGETSLLYADRGSGKSYIAVWLACAVSLGLDLPAGLEIQGTGPVVYLDWETSPATIAWRLSRVSKGFRLSQPPSVEYLRLNIPLVDAARWLLPTVAALHPRLVIVDSVGPAVKGPINEAQAANETMNVLARLGGITRLLIHHMAHQTAESNGQGHAYGSRYLENLSRAVWEMRTGEPDDEDEIRFGLWQRKLNDGPKRKFPLGLRLVFDGLTGPVTIRGFDVGDDESLSKRLSLKQQILVVLRGGKMSTSTIAEALDAKAESVKRTCARMPQVVQLEGGGGRGQEAIWGLKE